MDAVFLVRPANSRKFEIAGNFGVLKLTIQKIDDATGKRHIIIFIVLIFIKISHELGDIGKTAGVKLALETPSEMLIFKNSSA